MLKVEAGGGLAGPGVGAQGLSALQAEAHALEFFFGHGAVDVFDPVGGALDGPLGQQCAEAVGLGRGRGRWRGVRGAGVEACVGPLFGAVAEAGGEGVALDVATEGEEIVVAFDGKAFEAALVKMAIPDGVVRHPPAHGVGMGEAAEEIGQFAFLLGPDDEMPVRGHDAVGEKRKGAAFVSFEDDSLEGVVVGVAAEHLHLADRAIEDVIDQAGRRVSSGA